MSDECFRRYFELSPDREVGMDLLNEGHDGK